MVANVIKRREIAEVVHFTTHSGVLGILDTRSLLPNAELRQEKRLEHILTLNNEERKDKQWAGYNSMSITEPNRKFFSYSRWRINEPQWWCVLAFDPSVMEDDGVIFCTGNNTWPRTLRRTGPEGLEGMFAEKVPGTYSSWVNRATSTPSNVPTSLEAEFLYPGRISLERLKRVYFEHSSHASEFTAYARTMEVPLPDGCAVVDPAMFKA